jgi:hypothetical protein
MDDRGESGGPLGHRSGGSGIGGGLRRIRTAVAMLGLALLPSLGCSDAPALADCAPKNGLTPICRFQAPEDLAVVGHWLIVSQMPTAKAPGSLIAFHPESRATRLLYPPLRDARGESDGGSVAEADAPDGGCAAGAPPPVEDFAPHGIDVQGTRLLVVNHGRREAIEEFVLSGDRGGPALAWQSCTALPADASANDVVALADGGFAATKMIERPQWLGLAKLLLGLNTGALLRHSPTTGAWETVPNSEGMAPNGVEVETDGTFYIAEWTGHRIVRLAADGSRRESVELDFSPDNLAWAQDGRLLVAGQRASALDVPGCAALEEGTCVRCLRWSSPSIGRASGSFRSSTRIRPRPSAPRRSPSSSTVRSGSGRSSGIGS